MNLFFYIILTVLVLDYMLERLLAYLNSTYWSDQLPKELEGIYDQEKYKRSQQYEKSKQKFAFVLSTLTLLAMLFMLVAGGFAWMDAFVRQYTYHPIPMALLFFGILGFVSNLLSLPFDVYHVFVLEEKFGFNLTTATRFGKPYKQDLEMVYNYFPALVQRRKSLAGYCSGGELQMLVIGRALMAHPQLLLLDEPSLGLAPLLVQEIFRIIRKINEEHATTIILVEQNARMAMQVAHYGYVMENGKIMMEGTSKELSDNPDIKEFYLGMAASGIAKSYKDVKSYRRRKRWL